MYNQTAEQLFNEYRNCTEKLMSAVIRLRKERPHGRCPATEASFERAGILAELWGTIASQGSTTHRNYLEEWRIGQ